MKLNETVTSQKPKRNVSEYQNSIGQRNIYSREKDTRSQALNPSLNFSWIGLENIGNTWYLNVILQCLFHLKEFNKIFENDSYKRMLNSSQSTSMCTEYATLLSKLKETPASTPSKSRFNWKSRIQDYVSTKDFKYELWKANPSFRGYDQHDAHEFWTTLLDLMSKELNRVTK